MLHFISTKSALFLINRQKIENIKFDFYLYGFELFYSTILTAGVILLQAFILKKMFAGIVFIFYFASTRLFVGGYHASTYRKCFFISNLLFLIVFFISSQHNNSALLFMIIIGYIISFILLFFYSINTLYLKLVLRKILILQMLLCMIMTMVPISKLYATTAMVSTITVMLLTFQNKKENKND